MIDDGVGAVENHCLKSQGEKKNMFDRGWAPSNVSLLPLAGHGDNLVRGRPCTGHASKVSGWKQGQQ